MDWSKGFSARYYASIVDPITWKDVEDFNIIGGSINRSLDELCESASLECTSNYEYDTENYIRIYMDARQDGDSEHIALFTGLASSPSISIDGEYISKSLSCYSVLRPASDILLERGWYAAAGSDGAQVIKKLLNVIPAPVDIEGGAKMLAYSIIAENGETHLSMANKILDAMSWRFVIDGNGRVVICPLDMEPVANFNSINNDCLEASSVSIEYDWFNAPNVFRAVYGEIVAVVKDESETSPLSIQNRGREVWAEEIDAKIAGDESITSYAKRRLAEEQRTSYSVSYNRRFYPDVNISDLIYLNYPAQNINGTFFVDTQTINLGYNATVSETVTRYI